MTLDVQSRITLQEYEWMCDHPGMDLPDFDLWKHDTPASALVYLAGHPHKAVSDEWRKIRGMPPAKGLPPERLEAIERRRNLDDLENLYRERSELLFKVDPEYRETVEGAIGELEEKLGMLSTVEAA